MLQFLTPQTDLNAVLPASYDALLVIASYVIAVFGSYAGLMMSERAGVHDSGAGRKWGWLVAGGVVMGVSVWAMHFTGMLAFSLSVPMAYDTTVTTLSVIPAVLASGLALYVISKGRSHARYIVGGTLIGAGIGIMHYTGMAGVQLDALLLYDPGLFAMSIAVAVVLGILALYGHDLRIELLGRSGRYQIQPLGAALMGLAITGMHYTAMSGAYFCATPSQGTEPVSDVRWLSAEVIVISIAITILAIAAAIVDRRLQSTTHLLKLTQQRMVEAIESLTDGFILFDGSGKLVMCNGVFRRMYPTLSHVLEPGTPYELVLRSWAESDALPEAASNTEDYVERCIRQFQEGSGMDVKPEEHQLGDGRWLYVRQQSVKSGGLVGVWTDVTPIKELQSYYEVKANHDELTGLPNRLLFADRLTHALAHLQRIEGTIALLYVDLDNFKPVNDTHGHEVGDLVLQEVAQRLKAAVRESDTVARVGGDEFAVILEPQGDVATAEIVARRILQFLSEPIHADGKECAVGASIGISIGSSDAMNDDELMRQADASMYEAKRSGRNTFRFHAG